MCETPARWGDTPARWGRYVIELFGFYSYPQLPHLFRFIVIREKNIDAL